MSASVAIEERKKLLSDVWLFHGASDEELTALAELAYEVTIGPHVDIVKENEFGDELFLVVDGHTAVTRGGVDLSVLNAGDFFGEMALLGTGVRTSTVRSIVAMQLLGLRAEHFDDLLAADPVFARRVLSVVVRRLEGPIIAWPSSRDAHPRADRAGRYLLVPVGAPRRHMDRGPERQCRCVKLAGRSGGLTPGARPEVSTSMAVQLRREPSDFWRGVLRGERRARQPIRRPFPWAPSYACPIGATCSCTNNFKEGKNERQSRSDGAVNADGRQRSRLEDQLDPQPSTLPQLDRSRPRGRSHSASAHQPAARRRRVAVQARRDRRDVPVRPERPCSWLGSSGAR